jgi:Xaa-Pro aminopeptidase
MKRVISDQGLSLPRRLGLELDVLPANLYLGIQSLFEETELVDAAIPIRRIRAVKSDYEIDHIREAARGADAVAAFAAGALAEGMPEVELAGKVEAEARRLGHQGFVRMRLWDHELFYGHLMAGPGAAVPSYLSSPTGGASMSPAVAQGSSLRPIRRGEPVLVDYVFAKNGYIADHTRIFAVGGLDDDLLTAHQAALDIQKALLEAIRPDTPAGAIYDLAVEQAAGSGLGDHFMGAERGRIRFVGHGIGLELDEFPFLARGQKMPLKAGMVIALEPKMIFPGRGVVGIENTHVITQDGAEQVTRFPDEIGIV